MKKHLLFISLFAILFAAACTSRTNNQQAVQPTAPALDTTGFAAFQDWKFMNETKSTAEYTDASEQTVAAAPAKTVRKKAPVKKAPVQQDPAAPVVSQPETPASQGETTATPGVNGNESGTVGSESTNEAKEKKGISNAVKGTVIGAVSGAVLGAVINKKNRVAGGVIGGVLGGGAGYGIGRKMDKKEGR